MECGPCVLAVRDIILVQYVVLIVAYELEVWVSHLQASRIRVALNNVYGAFCRLLSRSYLSESADAAGSWQVFPRWTSFCLGTTALSCSGASRRLSFWTPKCVVTTPNPADNKRYTQTSSSMMPDSADGTRR